MSAAAAPVDATRVRSWRRLASGVERLAPPDERAKLGVSVPRRTTTGLVLTWLGIAVVAAIAVVYAVLGSPIGGLAVSSVAVALVLVTFVVPQNVPLAVVGNGVTSVSWAMTYVAAYRTGGISSPAIVWCFMHPITTYLSSGRRSAMVWTGLSALQLAVIFAADDFGVQVHHDLSDYSASVLRNFGFLTCVLGTVVLIAGAESARRASDAAVAEARKTLERQRLLGDMHDGIGSQLLGLMIQVRAKQIDDDRLLQGLNSCLDDLKLIVDSLDPVDRSFDVAVAELRARMEPRCAAAGVELAWRLEEPSPAIDAEQTLQVLRVLQEAMTNALRHARTDRIEVSLGRCTDAPACYEVIVRDHGVGFDVAAPPRTGRGLTSLRSRAQRLGGDLRVHPAEPGTAVSVRFPLAG